MKPFEYAAPRDEAGVLALLSDEPGHTEVLAGGTDLISLMKQFIVTPERVVNIKEVASLRGVSRDSLGTVIGAVTNLDDLLAAPELADYPAITLAIRGMNSAQLQAMGTVGGDLCQRPRCWYYRDGHGRLNGSQLAVDGDHRYHAILGNTGPAKYVHPSRLAPALIALDARLRIAGPGVDDELLLPVEAFFQTPRHEQQREHVLQPNQLITHILLPAADGVGSATYEVRHGQGPDFPLAAAASAVRIEGGIVQAARIVLGHVAPVPWVATSAVREILGKPVTYESARVAGEAAVAGATPLPNNRYKVQLAKVAVQRSLLLAAGLETGGF